MVISRILARSLYARRPMRFSKCLCGLNLDEVWLKCVHAFHSTGRDELLDTAMALHDAAMKDEYFVKRKLAPNVDFW